MSVRFITHQSFFSAVRSGDLKSIKEALKNDGLDSDHPAAASASASISSGLMELQNDKRETALYVATESNNEKVFSYLLKFCHLQTVRIKSKKSGLDAFHVAAKTVHLGIVKELLGMWPELCKSCDSSNTSPVAAEKDHLEVVNAILDADVNSIRIVWKNGKTALHNAIRYGRIRVVKALLDRDPEIVSIKDKKGQTALHVAVKGQDTSVIEELLFYDHSILNERDKKGNTAAHKEMPPQETAMDLADKLNYGEPAFQIKEALTEAGAKYARHVGQLDEAMELKRTVSDIMHEVYSQLIQNEKTQRRVSGIAKELKKIR